ncbi:MAG: extracellular solute-binding protein [Firmicutes bacterium]|nr:extracellular solute-binding protein [Bacillota bacterium]
MKHLARITAVFLAVTMALTLAAHAESDADYTGGLPDGVITREPITLNVYQWALDNQTTDFENLWFYKQLEADTNVTINWTVIKESMWNDQMNMMFVSGDYPDIIIRPNDRLSIEEYGVTQGILIPLNGYIEANMPNYAGRLGLNNVAESMTASDGKMYSIGYLVAQNINHEANWFINKAWLDAVGMEIPSTIDELTEVLKAFRDNKLGGDVTLPMSAGGEIYHQTQGLYTHFAMFGVPLQYFVYACIDDAGTVVFPGYMDGFREACEWLNMCYAEGLLDKDALTQSDNDWNVKVNGNQVGFTTYLRLINTAWSNPDTIENWVSILPPATERGATTPRVLEIPQYGAVLTSANKHIPESLRWLDAQLETERMLVAANGPAQPGGPIDPCLRVNDSGKYEVVYIPQDNGLYQYVPVTQGQFFAPGDYYFDVFELPPHRIERKDYSKAYEEAGVVEKNSYMILHKLVKPSPEAAADLERLYQDIHTFMREKIAAFVVNGVTDASWAQFLREAKNVGADRYVATYQALYDAYAASLAE